MNPTVVISLLGIFTAAIISLIVAYLHRKQMRQIEAFRLDPSVGLIPPAHPIMTFVVRRKMLFLGCGSSLVVLVMQLTRPEPVTRLSVFMIAFGVGGVSISVLLYMLGRLLTVVEEIVGVTGKLNNLTGGIITVTKSIVEVTHPSPDNEVDP